MMLYAHTVGTDEFGDRPTGQASWAYWIFLPELNEYDHSSSVSSCFTDMTALGFMCPSILLISRLSSKSFEW